MYQAIATSITLNNLSWVWVAYWLMLDSDQRRLVTTHNAFGMAIAGTLIGITKEQL